MRDRVEITVVYRASDTHCVLFWPQESDIDWDLTGYWHICVHAQMSTVPYLS